MAARRGVRSMRWLVAGVVVAGCGGRAAHPPTVAAVDARGYDPALAARLGADEYGMAKYVVAFLRSGPNRDQSPEEAERLMAAHLANIRRMAEAGTLVVAGPFLDDGPLRGIYIFRVDTLEEARALTATDPAIQAGRLEMELHPWYGSAALREVTALHGRIQQTIIGE